MKTINAPKRYKYRVEKKTGFAGFVQAIGQFLFGGFIKIFQNREILLRTTVTDIQTLYAGSFFGTFWLIFGQIMILGIYTLTYVVIFRIRPTDLTILEYILYVFCGLASFLAFSGALSGGTLSLASNRSVLMNTVFPAELLPLRAILVASAGMPIAIIILFAVDAGIGTIAWTWMLVPFVILFQIMFIAGLTWILSLLALVFKDLQFIIYYGIMMLMFLTPIAYTPAMVPDGLSFLISINPCAYFVISLQYLIMLDQLPPLAIMVAMITSSILMFMIGYAVCRRVKGSFYDFA